MEDKEKKSLAGGRRPGSGRRPSISTLRVIDELLERPEGISASDFTNIEFDGEKIFPSTASAILVRLEKKNLLHSEKQGTGKHIKNVYFIRNYKRSALLEYKGSVENKLLPQKEKRLQEVKSKDKKLFNRYVTLGLVSTSLTTLFLLFAFVYIVKNWYSQTASLTILSNIAFSQLNLDEKALKISFQEELNSLQFLSEKTTSSLRKLDLSGSNISNLKPIITLTELEDLNLSNTKVEDLEPLTELSNLRVLDISYIQVKDIEPLLSLTLEQLFWKDGDPKSISKLETKFENLDITLLENDF